MAAATALPLPSNFLHGRTALPSEVISSERWMAGAQVSLPQRAGSPSMTPSTLALSSRAPLPVSTQSGVNMAHDPFASQNQFNRSQARSACSVCPCGNVLEANSRFCPRCGAQMTAQASMTMGGSMAPFGVQSVNLAPPAGVPEALYQGARAADQAEATAVSQSQLERQLALEESMDGIENSHKARQVWNIQVTDEHFSSMPDWNRREWNHDPFYGWRTQEESKIPQLPAVKRALEAERVAKIDARRHHAQLVSGGVNVTEDPFMAPDLLTRIQDSMSQLSLFEALRPRPVGEPRNHSSTGTDFQKNHGLTVTALEAKQRLANAVSSSNAEEMSAAIKDCRNANIVAPARPLDASNQPGPSWHDAQIGERLLGASHMRGNWLAQPEAVKQRTIIDYDIPVGIFVGDGLRQAGGQQPPPPPPAREELRTWGSMYTPAVTPGAAGSWASTAATDNRVPYPAKNDPYDYYHTSAPSTRAPSAGPAVQPQPGPLWFLGL